MSVIGGIVDARETLKIHEPLPKKPRRTYYYRYGVRHDPYLKAFWENPEGLTVEEAAQKAQKRLSSARRRIQEMATIGLVEVSGVRAKEARSPGPWNKVWVLTPKGQEKVQHLNLKQREE